MGDVMRYDISEQSGEVHIAIETEGHTSEVLSSIRACQQGDCSCPTDQYDRLERIDVAAGEDTVQVRLRPREGERLDTDELRTCLDWTSRTSREGRGVPFRPEAAERHPDGGRG